MMKTPQNRDSARRCAADRGTPTGGPHAAIPPRGMTAPRARPARRCAYAWGAVHHLLTYLQYVDSLVVLSPLAKKSCNSATFCTDSARISSSLVRRLWSPLLNFSSFRHPLEPWNERDQMTCKNRSCNAIPALPVIVHRIIGVDHAQGRCPLPLVYCGLHMVLQ